VKSLNCATVGTHGNVDHQDPSVLFLGNAVFVVVVLFLGNAVFVSVVGTRGAGANSGGLTVGSFAGFAGV
jgi:hypothetical protein